jgi:hypothetical protein
MIQIVTDGYDSARRLSPGVPIVNLEIYILFHEWAYHNTKHNDEITKSHAYKQTLTEGPPPRDHKYVTSKEDVRADVRDPGFSHSPQLSRKDSEWARLR